MHKHIHPTRLPMPARDVIVHFATLNKNRNIIVHALYIYFTIGKIQYKEEKIRGREKVQDKIQSNDE